MKRDEVPREELLEEPLDPPPTWFETLVFASLVIAAACVVLPIDGVGRVIEWMRGDDSE